MRLEFCLARLEQAKEHTAGVPTVSIPFPLDGGAIHHTIQIYLVETRMERDREAAIDGDVTQNIDGRMVASEDLAHGTAEAGA